MVLDQTVDHILAVLSPHLGSLGLLVDDRFTLLVKDVDSVEFEGIQAVVIGIQQCVAHHLGVNLLAHTAVIHVFVILLNFDAVGECPGLSTVTRLVVGERRLELVEGLVVAVHSHRQTGNRFLGLVHKQLLCRSISSQRHNGKKYDDNLFHNLHYLMRRQN